ncbi:MAG: hypothetical protein MZV49_05095 [Rhodopseudomonas palustris]|nr:hypothetical protein [Rhodopseudomonas palustris]
MEYRGVETKTGERSFTRALSPGTNNIGEFLGIVHALALLKKKNSPIIVYSDSRGSHKWVKDKNVGTKLPRNAKTKPLFDLVCVRLMVGK